MHKAPGKNFWHYFFEFFMLFLAVFCGFLVENFREHKIECEREEQYMKSLINDLARDTASINAGIPLKEGRIIAIDSVLLFFETHEAVSSIPGYVYRNLGRTNWDRHFRRNSGTSDQLKNAGGLRLIRNQLVLDSISAYELQWARAEYWRESYLYNQREIFQLLHKLIIPHELIPYKLKNKDSYLFTAEFPDSAVVRIKSEYMDELINDLFRQKSFTGQDKNVYLKISMSAVQLMELIKKEYHLE